MWLCDWLELPRLGIVHMRALGAACVLCIEDVWSDFVKNLKVFFL
jgi:hypothetical protein